MYSKGLSLESFLILSYLWGIETTFAHQKSLQRRRFYLTYEELKLYSRFESCYGCQSILSYLWGIETRKHLPTQERIKWDFILPMRNWNFHSKYLHSTYVADFILPMRNWNREMGIIGLFPFMDFILPMRNWNTLPFLYFQSFK